MYQVARDSQAQAYDDIPSIETAFSGLEDIYHKVRSGERLNADDGRRLYNTDNLLALGYLANMVREKINGSNTYFVKNYVLNYTNICELDCKFCSFYRKEGQAGAYLMQLDEIFRKVQEERENITEMHIVGGLHAGLPYDYYIQMLRGIKSISPSVHIKAFTAVEIDFFSRLYKKTVEKVLIELKEAGLDAMPGGGRKYSATVCAQKCSLTRSAPTSGLA